MLGVEIEGDEEGRVEEVFEFEGGSWSVSVWVDGFDLIGSEELVGWETEGEGEGFGFDLGRRVGAPGVGTRSIEGCFDVFAGTKVEMLEVG